MSFLYKFSFVDTHTFMYIIGIVFYRLTKIRHTKFLKFVKEFMRFLVIQGSKSFKQYPFFKASIKGMRFKIAGRLKGKLRAKSKILHTGSVPRCTENKNIEFSKTSVFTRYGVFGIKL